MKILNNKKGSAMLWTVLLIVILTILLGSIMMASYAYFNYTMYSVKRQQAYFTARSATNALIEELSSQEQKQVNIGGNISYEDVDPEILPERNSSISIDSFSFPQEMGTATAELSRGNGDEVDISVTATYADEEYTINSTVMRQPLYFAGIAIKNITLENGGNGASLKLGKNTDLYWNNSEKPFDSVSNGFRIMISDGNLVSKSDAIIRANTSVARHTFNRDVKFSAANGAKYLRKIWGPEEYIISNKTLKATDSDNTEYVSSVINTIKNISNYTLKYCNNTKARADTRFGYAGFKDDSGMLKVLQWLGMDNLYNDMRNESMSLTNQGNNALEIQYIKLLSLSNKLKSDIDKKKEDGNWFEQISADILDKILGNYITNNGFTVFDVSYIDFSVRNENTRDDDVIPLVYLFVDGGTNNGLRVRVKYGKDPAKESKLYQTTSNIEDFIKSNLENFFKIENNMAYVIVYLEENSSIELGCKVGGRNDNIQDLVFAYSIYGGDNTTVILNDKVTVLGEIYCDNLIVKGHANVTYTNSSGSQIAKQKVAEYWTIVNYSD